MTTEQIATRRLFLIGKPKPQGIIGHNREPGEVLFLLGGGALGLVCGLALPLLPLRVAGLVGFPAVAAIAVFLPWRKRTPYRWFEINRTYRRLLRTGAAVWRSDAMEAGTRLNGEPVDIATPPGVGRVHWMNGQLGHESFGVLLHLDRRSVTATLEIEGPGVGSRDSEDQEALVQRFGQVLQHVANTDGFVTRLSIMARTLPADPYAHAKDVELRGDPDAPAWLRASYDDLASTVSTSSEQHRAYLTAYMPYTRELAAEAESLRGDAKADEAIATVMARELLDIAERLADADITVRRPLDAWDLGSLIHSFYDPDHAIDQANSMTRRGAWPAEVDATAPTYLRSQTRESKRSQPWCHATAWVKEWPTTPVGVNFLAPLLVHTPDVIRTVAVTMTLEPTDVAIERMLTEKTNDDADTSRAAKLGRTSDPRDQAHSERVDQRGADLAAGAAGVNLVGYVSVSAPDPEELGRAKRTIRAAAGKSYLKLEWCDREHHRAFANTLPFAAGIRG